MRLLLSTVFTLAACGAPDEPGHARADAPTTTGRAPTRSDATACDANGFAYGTLLATPDGAVFEQQASEGVRIQRLRGVGCDLAPVGAPLAAVDLLDVDERGNVYVFPAAAPDDGSAIGTIPEGETGQLMNGVVVRVAPDDTLTTIVTANRGVWGFGVSPAGDAMWVTACGPNGIYAIDAFASGEHAREPLMAAPNTLWGQLPSVLTDADTFWSVGARTCAWDAPLSDACGLALVRATAKDVTDVGATVADFGVGFEQATLTRCGANVCAVYPSAVVVHEASGAARAVLSFPLSEWGERIGFVSGTAHGVYVRVDGPRGGRRLVFAPLE
jgi:hypothetical protein